MSKDICNIAICQIKVSLNKEDALNNAQQMVSKAAAEGAELIVLPEMFHCPYSKEYFVRYAEPSDGPVAQKLSTWAKNNGVWLIGGSIPEQSGERMYNTSLCYDSNVKLVAKHRKVHLFDINIENGIKFMESEFFTPGKDITVFDTEFGQIGVAICFDIRFPEIFRAMAMRGARLIIVPAQFNTTTGPAHWENTIRSRALDNQLFVAAASCARDESFSYIAYGHSAIADPWGRIIASADEKEAILHCSLDFTQVETVRKQLPIFSGLRKDVYDIAK
jgi:predicted amidohydrolase